MFNEIIREDIKDDTKYDTPIDWDGGVYSSFNYESKLLYGTKEHNQIMNNLRIVLHQDLYKILVFVCRVIVFCIFSII